MVSHFTRLRVWSNYPSQKQGVSRQAAKSQRTAGEKTTQIKFSVFLCAFATLRETSFDFVLYKSFPEYD
jgi:hypothetical protein